ncbi:Type III effector HopPmaJ [hydrothermal vent metagenome]|uniref:Type III effector HopPmaJ n=2 Tax=hydrothermal vent metagenome TaxID=652676 RepID=A0A3B0YD24_9ZZZZ
MNIQNYLKQLKDTPHSIHFQDTISVIDAHYDFTPTGFTNATLVNLADENNGSCKIFAFAQLENLSPEQTLHCFGDYYRKDVLQNPQSNDHQNIRNFMHSGWSGISFNARVLTKK